MRARWRRLYTRRHVYVVPSEWFARPFAWYTAAVGPEETQRRRAFFAAAFALCGIVHAHSAFPRVVFALLVTMLPPNQSAFFVRHLCNQKNTGWMSDRIYAELFGICSEFVS